MQIVINDLLAGIDWEQAKVDLARDDFDNGRSPDALRHSFERSQYVAFARDDDRVVGIGGFFPTVSLMPTSLMFGQDRPIDVEASHPKWYVCLPTGFRVNTSASRPTTPSPSTSRLDFKLNPSYVLGRRHVRQLADNEQNDVGP